MFTPKVMNISRELEARVTSCQLVCGCLGDQWDLHNRYLLLM